MIPSTQLVVLADHPKLQQLYAHRLREHGLRVDVASSVEEGVVAAIVLRPRLIIAEWLLTGGHGLELVQRLRGIAATSSIPILFLTDDTALPVTVHRTGDGPVDSLTKPFSFEQLLQKVERWLAAPPSDTGQASSRRRTAVVAKAAARSPLAQKTEAVIEELVESGLLRRRERTGAGGAE
jgi:DNA-binding response OmpR family regulator